MKTLPHHLMSRYPPTPLTSDLILFLKIDTGNGNVKFSPPQIINTHTSQQEHERHQLVSTTKREYTVSTSQMKDKPSTEHQHYYYHSDNDAKSNSSYITILNGHNTDQPTLNFKRYLLYNGAKRRLVGKQHFNVYVHDLNMNFTRTNSKHNFKFGTGIHNSPRIFTTRLYLANTTAHDFVTNVGPINVPFLIGLDLFNKLLIDFTNHTLSAPMHDWKKINTYGRTHIYQTANTMHDVSLLETLFRHTAQMFHAH